MKIIPDEKKVRHAFEDLATNQPRKYSTLQLNDFFIGYCMALGMTASEAVIFVEENPVCEDEV